MCDAALNILTEQSMIKARSVFSDSVTGPLWFHWHLINHSSTMTCCQQKQSYIWPGVTMDQYNQQRVRGRWGGHLLLSQANLCTHRIAEPLLMISLFLGTGSEHHCTPCSQRRFSSDAKFSISKTGEQVLTLTFVVYEHFFFFTIPSSHISQKQSSRQRHRRIHCIRQGLIYWRCRKRIKFSLLLEQVTEKWTQLMYWFIV